MDIVDLDTPIFFANSICEYYEKSNITKKILYDIESGTATYKEANEYAEEVGELLATVFQKHLSSDVLPDGRMYYNIANRVVRNPLEYNHKLVSTVCADVQTNLNKQVGLGLKGIPPKINKDRINGLVDKVSDAEEFDEVKNILDEPVVNFTMSIVDDAIKENAEFQFMSGLAPKIKRTSNGHCCDWCEKLAGTYNYEDVRDTGNDVFRRHRHCRCTVEFITNGKRQNVHTKKWMDKRNAVAKNGSYGIIKLPRYQDAVIPKEKFTLYALNPDKDPDKARAFKTALGYTTDNAEGLIKQIREKLSDYSAVEKGNRGWGMTYEVVMDITGPNGKTAKVLTAWIDDKNKGEMRLTTVHVDD